MTKASQRMEPVRGMNASSKETGMGERADEGAETTTVGIRVSSAFKKAIEFAMLPGCYSHC